MERTNSAFPVVLAETVFNLNQQVKVRLTNRGLEVLTERLLGDHSDMFAKRDVAKHIAVYERDGEYTFMFWMFMALFGPALPTIPHLDPKYHLFEGNNVVLVPDRFDLAVHNHSC